MIRSLSVLCENKTIEIITYRTQYKTWKRGGTIWYDNHKVSKYLLAKYWNSDQTKAEYLHKLLFNSKKYSKVELSKRGCVFATRKVN